MSDPGYTYKIFNSMIDDYNSNGENFVYHRHRNKGLKIVDMSNHYINNEIFKINSFPEFDPRSRAWLEIFEDVLKKRIFNKLKKIKSNII